MSEERGSCILHIIIAVHTFFDLYKCRADIRDNIFHFAHIDVAQPVAAGSPVFFRCAVDLNDLPVFQKKGPYPVVAFFDQDLPFQSHSSFLCCSFVCCSRILHCHLMPQ